MVRFYLRRDATSSIAEAPESELTAGTHAHSAAFDAAQRVIAEYQKAYPENPKLQEPGEFIYRDPDNYKGMRYDHFVNFFDSIRNGTPVVQDAVFGLRAAGPTFAGNQSYYEQTIVKWDPEEMRTVS